MNCLVTGAAGFIGSHLCQSLTKKGFFVTGVDSFTDFYSRKLKEQNLSALNSDKRFVLIPEDLNSLDLNKILMKMDCVFHFAAQAGVRSSWGKDFTIYLDNNIKATQKLLEAAKAASLKKFIYASSSSVYGLCPELPMNEDSPLHPYSPYGVSKLAAENLCTLYFHNYGIPAVSLRFFTVFGPRQRPDMAFHKFFKAILENKPIPVFGDGSQTRDFTYVDDIVNASISALENGKAGEVYNLGGGSRKKLIDIISLLEKVSQKKIQIHWEPKQEGDVAHTFAAIHKAAQDLYFSPNSDIKNGLTEEWTWIKNIYSEL